MTDDVPTAEPVCVCGLDDKVEPGQPARIVYTVVQDMCPKHRDTINPILCACYAEENGTCLELSTGVLCARLAFAGIKTWPCDAVPGTPPVRGHCCRSQHCAIDGSCGLEHSGLFDKCRQGTCDGSSTKHLPGCEQRRKFLIDRIAFSVFPPVMTEKESFWYLRVGLNHRVKRDGWRKWFLEVRLHTSNVTFRFGPFTNRKIARRVEASLIELWRHMDHLYGQRKESV